MHITVAGKQVETGEALKTHVNDGLTAITAKYFDHALEANVTFHKHRSQFSCDINLKAGRGLMMRAEGEEIDDDDTDDESIDSYDEEGFIRYEDESVPIVSIDQVTALLEQNNVSYKELVAFLILPDSRHQSDLQEYNNARMKQIAILCSSLNI